MNRGSARWRKVALLSALYLVQGLPFGFQAKALPIYLREIGTSLVDIGLAGMLAAPWMLKPLWAPLVDRYGTRRAWILPAQAGLALACGAAALIPAGSQLGLLMALVFVMNLCAATQDIAVDGLAVDLLRDDELGPGNAAQVVGFKIGMLTSGGLLVYLSGDLGWSGIFAMMSALVAMVAMIALFIGEPPRQRGAAARGPRLREILVVLRRAVLRPGGAWALAVIATYKLGESMVDSMFKPFLVDADFGAESIGLWVGTWGMGFSVAGSIAGGWLAARGIYRALVLAALLRVLPLAGQTLLALSGPTTEGVIVATCAEHFFGGALTTAMFAFMMRAVDRSIGATHFTLLAAVEVIGKSPSAWLAGLLATWLGYVGLFALGTGISIAFLALLPMVRPVAARSLA